MSKYPKRISTRSPNLRHEEMVQIIDHLIPVASGRNYRIQIGTTKYIQQKYKETALKEPLNLTTFSNYLKTLKIHHVKYYNCPICEVDSVSLKNQHDEFWKFQRKSFMEQNKSH